jgi:glycosyltransferase involved in cell wall biosynthesis
MINLKIHYHTDCPVFGGCENMLPLFFNDKEFYENNKISFSYKYTKEYENELNKRLINKIEIFKIKNLGTFKSKTLLLNNFIKLIGYIFYVLFFFIDVYIVCKILIKTKPDILHINNGGYPGARSCRAAVFAAKIAGVKSVIMVVNNISIKYNLLFHILNYPIDKFISKNVDLFITGSTAASISIKKRLNLSDHKLKVIHNGIKDLFLDIDKINNTKTLSEFNIKAENKVIFGIVGLLTPRKGHFTLLNLLKNNKQDKSFNNALFLIIGSGELKREIIDFLDQNQITNVIMIAHQNNIFDILKCIDVLIVPSTSHEDFPFVILEAMSVGKPIIGTKLAGIPEQVDDLKNGILIEPGNQFELGNALKKLLAEPSLRVSMGEYSRKKFVEEFTSDISIKNYLNIYQELKIKNNI